MTTGAATPTEITHAFSLSGGHLAWAIATGKKVIENRKFRLKPGWYGVAVTLNAHTGVLDNKWYREKYGNVYPGFSSFDSMRGHVVAVCNISHSLPHEACKDDDHAHAAYPIKNIISRVVPLVSGVPAKGNLGTWPLSCEARDELRIQLGNLLAGGTDVVLRTNAEIKYPKNDEWSSKSKAGYEDAGKALKAASKAKPSSSKSNTSKATGCDAPSHSKAVPRKTIKKPVPKPAVASKPVVPAPLVASKPASDIRSFFK